MEPIQEQKEVEQKPKIDKEKVKKLTNIKEKALKEGKVILKEDDCN